LINLEIQGYHQRLFIELALQVYLEIKVCKVGFTVHPAWEINGWKNSTHRVNFTRYLISRDNHVLTTIDRGHSKIQLTYFFSFLTMATTPSKRLRESPIDVEAIETVAEEVIGVPFARKAEEAKNKSFKEHFGCKPIVVAKAWEMIEQYTSHDAPEVFSIKHLLWALIFLKTYSVEGIRTTLAAGGTGIRPDTKTVRDMTWVALECLANLEPYVVSIIPCFYYCVVSSIHFSCCI
jgi:hypothetical protein